MVEIFVLSVVFMVSCLGWGTLVAHLYRLQVSISNQVVLGLFLVSFLALTINFLLPMSAAIVIFLWIFGLFFAGWIFRSSLLKFSLKPAVADGFILFLICGYGMLNGLYSDVAAYHFPTVNWISRSPLVLGLANLHDRFGFNSLWHFSSVMSNPFLRFESSVDVASLILVFLFVVRYFEIQPGERTLPGILRIVALVIWGKSTFFSNIGLPATDLPSAILAMLILENLFLALSRRELTESDFKFLALLLCFAVLVKLSQVFLIFPMVIVYFLVSTRPTIPFAFLAGLAFLASFWLLRSFLLSGCWVFPVTATCIPDVLWSLPLSEVQSQKEWIYAWARIPQVPFHEIGNITQWFPVWFESQLSKSFVVFFLISFVVFFVPLIFLRIEKRNLGLILISVFPTVLFWFMSAPDLRFNLGVLIFLNSIFLIPAYIFCEKSFWRNRVMLGIVGILCLFFLQDILRISIQASREFPVFANRFSIFDRPDLLESISQNGVKYVYPDVSKNEETGCWLVAESPCANTPRPRLAETSWGQFRIFFSK